MHCVAFLDHWNLICRYVQYDESVAESHSWCWSCWITKWSPISKCGYTSQSWGWAVWMDLGKGLEWLLLDDSNPCSIALGVWAVYQLWYSDAAGKTIISAGISTDIHIASGMCINIGNAIIQMINIYSWISIGIASSALTSLVEGSVWSETLSSLGTTSIMSIEMSSWSINSTGLPEVWHQWYHHSSSLWVSSSFYIHIIILKNLSVYSVISLSLFVLRRPTLSEL